MHVCGWRSAKDWLKSGEERSAERTGRPLVCDGPRCNRLFGALPVARCWMPFRAEGHPREPAIARRQCSGRSWPRADRRKAARSLIVRKSCGLLSARMRPARHSPVGRPRSDRREQGYRRRVRRPPIIRPGSSFRRAAGNRRLRRLSRFAPRVGPALLPRDPQRLPSRPSVLVRLSASGRN